MYVPIRWKVPSQKRGRKEIPFAAAMNRSDMKPRETQSAAKQQLVPFFRPQVLSQMPSCIRRVLVIHVRVILASRGLKAWSCQLETSVLSLKKGVVMCLTVSQLA